MKKSALSELMAALVLAGLFGFVGLTARAALAYSGGTYCEPDATSYRFWGNFFCDLTAPVTRRGIDNAPAAALATAAFAAFALAVGPFFWLLGGLVRRARLVRSLGLLSALATAALAWLPASAGTTLHALAVFSATIPGLVAAGAGVQGLLRRASPVRGLRATALLGAATLIAGFADAAGYCYALTSPGGCLPWLPALQKVVGLLLIAWMLAVSAQAAKPDVGPAP
jgi:hypothetical protein